MQHLSVSTKFLSRTDYSLTIARHLSSNYYVFSTRKSPTPNHLLHQLRRVSQSTYANYFSIDVFPIKCAYTLLDGVHTFTGMPWWATILTTTFALRTLITLPIFVLATKNNMKLEGLRPKIVKMSDDLKKEVSRAQKEFQWTPKMAYGQYKINMNRLMKEVYIKHNCHPGKNVILPWMQIPIWVSMSMALRNMSGSLGPDSPILCPDLSVEGTLWFQNMLIPDTSLSLIFFLTNFIIIEMHSRRMPKKTRMMKVVTNFSRVFNVVMLPIAMYMPCSLSFYWTCSSFYGLLQNIVVMNPTFKKALFSQNISPTGPEESHSNPLKKAK